MKKIIIFILLVFLLCIINQDNRYPQDELSSFISKYHLQYKDVKPYLNHHLFKVEDYFILEEFRKENHYTYLETINNYYLTRPSPAVLQGTTLILVNKQFYLTKGYRPYHLVSVNTYDVNYINDDIYLPIEVLVAYMNMIYDLGLTNLYLYSGFRTFEKQQALYDYYQDDNYSAKPGFSEHQTGLAIDVSTKECGLTDFFSQTFEYQTLVANCHHYGFILRYPQGRQDETGYYFEPWHLRYVGVIHAKYIKKHNLTLEKYLFENFAF